MTYEKIVEKVKKAYAKADLNDVKEHVAAQFNVTGEGEGAFYLEICEGKADVQPYEYFDRDFIVVAPAAEIIKIAEGKLDPVKAFETDRIIIEGDRSKLSCITVKTAAKKAVKKTAKKTVKPTAKKAAKVEVKAAGKTTVTKSQFVESVAQKAGISKSDAAAVVDAYAAVITEELGKGGKIQLAGFGTFETGARAARTGRNPFTGETIEIPASTTLKFKAAKALKNELN